jgi:AcrR family transcriptional regulator
LSTEVQSTTDAPQSPQTRRERQREATYDEITRASRELLAEGAELSLRAVAGRMGMTAPALYRYVASYQELVDLVAFEIDKAATATFAAAADRLPEDDHAGRLVASTTEFRMWALGNPREFTLAFANPIADANCIRRELLTISNSGHLMTGQMRALWEANHHPIPSLDELPPAVRESVLDPLIPAKVDDLPTEDRGLVWLYQQGWTALYGVVALEVFGHMDPRVIESGEMFVHVVREFAPKLGLADDLDRLEGIIRARLARG